jgi:hypothetical protein
MSVVVFGNYLATGAEGDSFDVGHTPDLSFGTHMGFLDQEVREGERVVFLVSGRELSSAAESAFESPTGFRDLLHSAPVITGTVVESGSLSARCRVERREDFRELYEQKGRSTSNEVLDVVSEYDGGWRSFREALERMGDAYRYSVGLQLPLLSAVRECVRRGLVATKRRWDSTLLLESFPEEHMVRVVAYGEYAVDSSRIYDIVDADEYRAAIEKRVADAQLKREARFWRYLLD